MSGPNEAQTTPTYFENRRTQFNSMHEINEDRVRGCRPARQCGPRRGLDAATPRFPPSPRQYEAHEFGLCEDEQFQHPRMFENLNFETNAGAFEAMRAANARPAYQQQPQFNICDLPSEQLDDFSSPEFSEAYDEDACNVCPQQQKTPDICDISAPDFCDISDASPWPAQTPPRRVQSPRRQQQRTPDLCDISAPDFCDISDASPWPAQTPPRRVQSPRRQQQRTPDLCDTSAPDFGDISAISTGSPRRTQSPVHQQRSRSFPDSCLDDESAPICNSTMCSPSPQVHYTPIGLMDTPDVCAPTPPAPTPTPPPHFSPIRLQPSPVQYPSECLEDISVPSFERTVCDMPSPARVQMPENLPSDMVCDISAPSFGSPPTPSMSFPSEALEQMTMPSFEDASCGSPLDMRFLLDSRLAEESPPSFASSRASSPKRSFSRRDTPLPAAPSSQGVCPSPCAVGQQEQQNYEPTPIRKRPPRRFNLAQLISQRSATAECSPMRASCPSTVGTPTPPAPHFSYYSPTPVRGHTLPKDLPSECLTDVSQPSYYSSPPRTPGRMRPLPSNLPSECLGDISEPSYERTPPARTPSLPHDLPSELLCDMSQPMYDTPRSERLSSMTMPSFEDASCGSPLDRRFLLDSRIMDESQPSFAPSPCSLSPCRSFSPCAQPTAIYPSIPHAQSRSATPQRSQYSPRYSPAPRSARSRSPSPVCSPTPPAPHFSLRSPTPVRSPTRCPMPTDMPDECLTDITEPEYFSSYCNASPPQMSFPSNMGSECISDISAPCFERTPPIRTPEMPKNLPSDMLCDISSPKYQSPGSEHLSYESMPSFADTSCGSPLDRRFLLDPRLADESMPTMVSSRSPSLSHGNQYSSSVKDESSFDKTYCEIIQRFNSLKSKLDTPPAGTSGHSAQPSLDNGGLPPGECVRETVIERTENENGQLESTTQHIVVTVDPCGSIQTHTKEIKTKFPTSSPTRLAPPSADSGILTQSPRPAAQIENLRDSIRRRLSFDLSDMPCDNLADITPPCADDLPSMSAENILQHLSSIPEEQLSRVSAPSYRTPPVPSLSYPSEMLDEMSIPSFQNASCGSPLDRRFLLDPRLADESPPLFASSYVSSPTSPYRSGHSTAQTPHLRSRDQTSFQAFTPQRPTHKMQPEFGTIKSPERFQPLSSTLREAQSPSMHTPPAPHFSLRSPTPIGPPPGRSYPTNLPHEQLADISEPTFLSSTPITSPRRFSLPRNMPSERLDDMSQPSYQRTPPPQTPRTPTNLPSEMLGNISAPSYQSPASEHISHVTMPSFADVSYESPLDRRFLLDPRIADESMPTLLRTPSTQRTPVTSTHRPGTSTPRPGAARRRLSYSQPDSTRGSPFRGSPKRSNSEGRDGQGLRGPATVEQTHTTIKQSGTYEQQHSVTPGHSGTQGRHDQTPLMDSAKEQLKITTSTVSISRVYHDGPTETATGGHQRRRSMSLPSENLGDISMPASPPSMGMSTTNRLQQRNMSPMSQMLNDVSMPPSPPSMSMTRTGRSTPRRNRRRSVQDVNDISPISFASTMPSTDRSGSTTGGGRTSGKYTSTSSRGFSGLANYAPFCEQIRSRNNSNACDPCDPCCPTVQDVDTCADFSNSDTCDPCAGFLDSNRSQNNKIC
ncbi:mucin-2-like isoform X1 [Bactrocera neohumeralis]|uniref:mucin-2-like isoform X1 n=2 Tax=Bactrocera neohumeralis TaxID=98809 RepID=UPI0021654903|nr:mucin-2-like isoform X1 [Bactrocera neohumeralis]